MQNFIERKLFVWEVLYSCRQETLFKNFDSRTKSLSSRLPVFNVQSKLCLLRKKGQLSQVNQCCVGLFFGRWVWERLSKAFLLILPVRTMSFNQHLGWHSLLTWRLLPLPLEPLPSPCMLLPPFPSCMPLPPFPSCMPLPSFPPCMPLLSFPLCMLLASFLPCRLVGWRPLLSLWILFGRKWKIVKWFIKLR